MRFPRFCGHVGERDHPLGDKEHRQGEMDDPIRF
jgi:hypothetical protein